MGNLKVLHINDGDLDDPRIISAALTGKKVGYDEYFCGENQGRGLNTNVFSQMRWIKIPNRARISKCVHKSIDTIWKWYPYPQHALLLKQQLKNVVDEIRPDIIHAHNIFVAHVASEFGIPLVLDDHEFYSLHIKAQNQGMRFRKRILAKIKEKLWSQWERELGQRHPIITVSSQIANHHKRYCKNTFVVPNYPNENTIKFDSFIESSKGKLCSAYLGRDSEQDPSSVRNITGLHDLFSTHENIGKLLRIGVSEPNTQRIRSEGLLRMNEAYKMLNQSSHIGLLPWYRHWFHQYCNPNKVYEYAHCGLWLITIDDLKPVIDDFGSHCDTFHDYEELTSLLEYYNVHTDELNEKRKCSVKHAQDNFIWEKHEQKILEAYKVA